MTQMVNGLPLFGLMHKLLELFLSIIIIFVEESLSYFAITNYMTRFSTPKADVGSLAAFSMMIFAILWIGSPRMSILLVSPSVVLNLIRLSFLILSFTLPKVST